MGTVCLRPLNYEAGAVSTLLTQISFELLLLWDTPILHVSAINNGTYRHNESRLLNYTFSEDIREIQRFSVRSK